jgi:hypothetical protein
MRKAIGYGLIYSMLAIGMSDLYFEYSPDYIIGAISTFVTVVLTASIAIALIEGTPL